MARPLRPSSQRASAGPQPLWRIIAMSVEKPRNDVADQLRAAEPEADAAIVDEEAPVGRAESVAQPPEVSEAHPADVADQHRVVPLPDDVPTSDDRWQ